MEFGLRLSRLIEGRASEAAKFTAMLLLEFPAHRKGKARVVDICAAVRRVTTGAKTEAAKA